jgi:hypothetical protein
MKLLLVIATILAFDCGIKAYRINPANSINPGNSINPAGHQARHEDHDHPDHVHGGLKFFFSTKLVESTATVMSTVTETKYETCYSAEAGITDCQRRRDLGDSPDQDVDAQLVAVDPNVELDGVAISWESIISPSRVSYTGLFIEYTGHSGTSSKVGVLQDSHNLSLTFIFE